MINAQQKKGQMAVCSQNLMLRVLSSHSALSLLVGVPFKTFILFLNTPHISETNHVSRAYIVAAILQLQFMENVISHFECLVLLH